MARPGGGIQHHTQNARGGNENQHQFSQRKHSKMDAWHKEDLLVSFHCIVEFFKWNRGFRVTIKKYETGLMKNLLGSSGTFKLLVVHLICTYSVHV